MPAGQKPRASARGSSLLFFIALYKNDLLHESEEAINSENYEEAYRKLLPLAYLGDDVAQCLLGYMYAFGWGVEKNDEEAIKWLRRAALDYEGVGNFEAPSEYFIGEYYAEGIGDVPKNEAEALKWFQRSAEGGYDKAAELLAEAYQKGLYGLEKDLKKSEYWSNKAKELKQKKH